MDQFLRTTGVARLNQLVAIAEQDATPWYIKYVPSISQITITRGG
jgi:hypothetical protein